MSEREKPSWRERDKMRGRSPARQDATERSRDRASKTAAYSQYKSQLQGLFSPSGTALPEAMREKLGPASPEATARRDRLAALQKHPSDATLEACVAAEDPLPGDPRFAMSLLTLKKDKNRQAALQHLLSLIEGGATVNPRLLQGRLQAVEEAAESGQTLKLIAQIREAID